MSPNRFRLPLSHVSSNPKSAQHAHTVKITKLGGFI
jgi:hypothetical protein